MKLAPEEGTMRCSFLDDEASLRDAVRIARVSSTQQQQCTGHVSASALVTHLASHIFSIYANIVSNALPTRLI